MFKKLEEIEVWNRACKIAMDIYRLCELEPLCRDWGLRDQLRRAAVSIASNIAEGYERNSRIEFRRFLIIAKGSCGELKTQLIILRSLEKIPNQDLNNLIQEASEISLMLGALISSLSKALNK